MLDEIDKDKRVFCDDCAYYDEDSWLGACNILHVKNTPERAEIIQSKCASYNRHNNCTYFKKMKLASLFFGVKKKIREKIYFDELYKK